MYRESFSAGTTPAPLPCGRVRESPFARVQRGESATARCTSTGDQRVTLSVILWGEEFREEGEDMGFGGCVDLADALD
jgi:hypothetical protein